MIATYSWPPRFATRDPRLRNNHGLGGLPVGGGGEGFVCFGEFESVSDHFVEGELLAVGAEEIDGGSHVSGFAGPGAEDLELFAGDDVRVELNCARIAIVAED